MDFAEVQELGKKYDQEHPGAFEEAIARGRGTDIALILYTSGTSKLPKGVLITYDNIMEAQAIQQARLPFYSTDQFLSFLPPCWAPEQVQGIGGGLYFGSEVNFPEEAETLMSDLRELGPNTLTLAPRVWQGMSSTVRARITDTTFLKRQIYDLLLPVGYKVAEFYYARQKTPLFWKTLYAIANAVLFRQLRDKLGLSRVRSCTSAGGALGEDIFRFYRAIGINIKQVYGATEGFILCLHSDEDVKFETVGTPAPGVEIKISDAGEVMAKGKIIFSGYYKSPEDTHKVLKDGWWCSGDAGFLDEDGHLILIDRADDVMKLPGGARFSPTYIENRLKFSHYIRDAVVLGGGDKPYITAIIDIDFENVGRWAESKHITYTTFADLSQKPEVYDLIEQDVRRANQILPEAVKIRRFVNMHKELDADEAELTRTRKIRRAFFEEHYKSLVDGLYGNLGEIQVSAAVKYRDGRMGTTQTTVRVKSLEQNREKKN
jgi:long-chain acyl-CoA synthetase